MPSFRRVTFWGSVTLFVWVACASLPRRPCSTWETPHDAPTDRSARGAATSRSRLSTSWTSSSRASGTSRSTTGGSSSPSWELAGGAAKAWERSSKRRHERRLETLRMKAQLKTAEIEARALTQQARRRGPSVVDTTASVAPNDLVARLFSEHDEITARWLDYELDVRSSSPSLHERWSPAPDPPRSCAPRRRRMPCARPRQTPECRSSRSPSI